jgi:hypothetical protein
MSINKVLLAVGLAAFTAACGPTGSRYAVPATAIVSPVYTQGYGYYTPYPIEDSYFYRPHLNHIGHYRRYRHLRHAGR